MQYDLPPRRNDARAQDAHDALILLIVGLMAAIAAVLWGIG